MEEVLIGWAKELIYQAPIIAILIYVIYDLRKQRERLVERVLSLEEKRQNLIDRVSQLEEKRIEDLKTMTDRQNQVNDYIKELISVLGDDG